MSNLIQPFAGSHVETFVVGPSAATVIEIQGIDLPSPTPERPLVASRYFHVKPWVDRLVTCVLLVPATPLMLVTAAAIMILDGRPILYRQTRVGKDGRHFKILKFRTMLRNAESRTGPVWSNDQDRRITPLGHWLRRSHLDELPQLLNVIRGEMNLIGPRPERPEFVEQLVEQLPDYRQRLTVRPGITGLAQLRLGYDRSISDVARKVEVDLTYIRTATATSDGKLLIDTVPYIVKKLLRTPAPARPVDRNRGPALPVSPELPTEPSPGP